MSARRLAVVTAVLVAAVPAPARADKVIEALTVWRYDAASYAMDQGELLTFRNSDLLSPGPHNVTASDEGPDGTPLFASATIPNGQEAPVEGARQLVTGSYGFFCTVHPFMEATLTVSDKGAPLPPPGSPPPPPPADTRAPAVTVSIDRTTRRAAVRRRRFGAVVTTDEAASLRLRMVARIGRRSVLVGTAASEGSGRTAVVVGIRRSALRALRRARRATLTLAVEARDAAGNLATATARRTIR